MPINPYKSSQRTERNAPKIKARTEKQVALRKGGMSFADIAKQFYMSENYVRRCINEAIRKRENG